MKRKFTTRTYKTSGANELWQMDLMEMIPYARINAGNRYILTCIDVFSRFARAEAVKNKEAKTVCTAIKKMLTKTTPPRHVQTDLGKEFYNKTVQDLFRNTTQCIYNSKLQWLRDLIAHFVKDSIDISLINVIRNGLWYYRK